MVHTLLKIQIILICITSFIFSGNITNTQSLINNVPYFWQYNNANAPGSTCQITAMAMVLKYYGATTITPDWIYNNYGYTSAQAPAGWATMFNSIATSKGLAVRASGTTSGSRAKMRALLDQNIPVVVFGYFTGSGHIIVTLGYDGTYYTVNDPAGKWGQTYMVGGYSQASSTEGKGVKYKATSYDYAVETPAPDYWMITLDRPLVEATALTLYTPFNNATNISISQTFTWKATTGATSYRLKVSKTSDFSGTLLYDANVGNVTSVAVSGMQSNTKYYWSVNDNNNVISTAWSFTTNNGTSSSLPILVIDDFESGLGRFATTTPLLNGYTSITLSQSTTENHNGGGSLQLNITPNGSATTTQGSRIQPASGASTLLNVASAKSVGLWVNGNGVPTGTQISVIMRDNSVATGALERSTPKDIINGAWTYYEWSFGDETNWDSYVSGDGVINSEVIYMDAISITTPGAIGTPYTVYVDDMGFGGVLPVELTSFTASNTSDGILLNWQTATELNNNGFEIERRYENSEYEKIGFVSGNGTSNNYNSYTYNDKTVAKSGNYTYRLKQIDFNGDFQNSKEVEVSVKSNVKFELMQNYPNPFNPTTKISYYVPVTSLVKVSIYDIAGNEITTLVNEQQNSGEYNINFNADQLSSGIYICRISTPMFTKSIKMTLIK